MFKRRQFQIPFQLCPIFIAIISASFVVATFPASRYRDKVPTSEVDLSDRRSSTITKFHRILHARRMRKVLCGVALGSNGGGVPEVQVGDVLDRTARQESWAILAGILLDKVSSLDYGTCMVACNLLRSENMLMYRTCRAL